ncbi:MAG: TlpA disulfide reductase family protein [Bacteroidota bacterium]
MKYLIHLFAIVLFFGCTENKSPREHDKNNNVLTKNATTAPKPSMVVHRDTTPRRNYVLDLSRRKDKIKQEYPFDIPVTNANQDSLNSEIILKKNGKPTVVLFWLTTCYPCRMELNALKKVYPEWKAEADFNLVAISTDFQKNYNRFLKRVEKENWPWETYHDTRREFRRIIPGALNGLPQTFIFDKNGKIVYHKRKYQSGDEHQLFEEVKKYL